MMQKITPETTRQNMKIPPELQASYDKIIASGMKLMFNENNRDETLRLLDAPGDIAEKIGEGVAALMADMFNKSNNTLPPQLVIPAGTELVVHAAEVAEKAGEQIDDNVVAEAMGTFIEAVLRQFGVKPEDIPAMVSGMTGAKAMKGA